MMVYPCFQEFEDLRNTTTKTIPIVMELAGDLDTPIGVYLKLCANRSDCFLLESVEGGERWARYSFIGRSPQVVIKAYGTRVEISRNGHVETRVGDVLQIAEEVMGEFDVLDIPSLPQFPGGAVGYFAYDTIRNYEHLPHCNPADPQIPDVHLLVPEDLVVYDHVKQNILLIQYARTGCEPATSYQEALAGLERIRHQILANQEICEQPPESVAPKQLLVKSNESKESFMAKVVTAKEHIVNGQIFQVVLSQRFSVQTEASPFAAYRALRSINPSPYLFYLDFGEYQLVGASPELLVKVTDDVVETCPIAGTRPRGATPEEDHKLAEELLACPKEQAEHRMLVDLGRNDIGKVAKFGTVEATNLMHIEKYSHVMHIVTNVTGRLDGKKNMYAALQACLPAGTVSGAPKIRAMEIIDQLETEKRGVYAGAVGYFGFNGNLDFCITIRTILFHNSTAYLQAGAGIVADSIPENEYEETVRKARVLVEALKRA